MPLGRIRLAAFLLFLPGVLTGQLERSSANPRYYAYRGQPRVLLGAGQVLVIGDSRGLDALVANGGNYARLWHHVPGAGRPLPWLRLSDGRYDLERWDEGYWTGLRELLRRASERSVIVSVPIWNQPGLEAAPEDRWPGHPFNPANNVNGLDLPAREAVPEFFDLANARLLALQDGYVERLAAELCAFDNVIVEITNEYTGPPAWEERWMDRVSAACPRAPIAQNRLPGPAPRYWTETRLDQVNYHNLRAEDVFDTFAANHRHGKVQHYDEQALGRQSERDIRRMAWGAVLGGGGINWDQSGNPEVTPGTSRALAAFLAGSGMDVVRARPDRSLLSPGFALVRDGQEVAGYVPEGDRVSLDLGAWPGSFRLRWFDPARGTFGEAVTLEGGARRTLAVPGDGDAAFHLTRAVAARSAIWGDLDRDGAVTTRDALLVLWIVDGRRRGDPDDSAGDVDGDGRIGLQDARTILGHAVGLEPSASRAGHSR
ncbi:MAG: DUF6298 domain-containing protein [Gemmatimonadota bacterium]